MTASRDRAGEDLAPPTVVGSAGQVWAVAVYEFLWDVRKWRTYIVVGVVLLVTLSIGLNPRAFSGGPGGFGGVSPIWWETTVSYVMLYLISGIFPLLIGGVLSTDSLSTEFDKGTIAALLAQPIRRSELYCGKLLEKTLLLLVVAAVLVGLALGTCDLSAGTQQQLVWVAPFVLGVTLVFIGFAAMAFFLGSLLPSGSATLGAMLGIFFALFIAGALLVVWYGFGDWVYFVPMLNGVELIPALQAWVASPGGTTAISVSLGASRSVTVSTASNLAFCTLGVVAESVILFLLGYLLFRRAEVKG